MSSATLIVEVLTEELPPKALQALGEAFAATLVAGLRTRDFAAADVKAIAYATPRRLAVAIAGVLRTSPDKPYKQKLLPVAVAYDAAGAATPALVKKLAALGLADASSLKREGDGKAAVLIHEGIAPGSTLAAGLQQALDKAIAELPIPKVMSYAGPGSYYNDEKFVRPAHGVLALHGADVVPVRALGLASGRTTAGHRFLSRTDIAVATADAYEETLRAEGKVIASFAARRAQIVAALGKAANGATVIMPDALLDEVTALVEWPVVYAGTFDGAFLAVPHECLILTMQANQRYFAIADPGGSLTNRFLLVANLDPLDPSALVQGNERVLRARLADARFFFDQDRKTTLEARVDRFRAIVFHHKLGTQADRMERTRFVAKAIAARIGADPAASDRAALLAKADLVTDMVG